MLHKQMFSQYCQVELCANWSDGWATHETCVQESVAFATLVTVSPIDCYYNLNIIGTSGDGTVSGYSWTVASGTIRSTSAAPYWMSSGQMDRAASRPVRRC